MRAKLAAVLRRSSQSDKVLVVKLHRRREPVFLNDVIEDYRIPLAELAKSARDQGKRVRRSTSSWPSRSLGLPTMEGRIRYHGATATTYEWDRF